MPRTKKGTPPSYRRHSRGQAVVTVRVAGGGRRDILLGPWDSPRSREEYARVLIQLNAHGGRYPCGPAVEPAPALTVNELILTFWQYATVRYGEGNKELDRYRYSLRPLRELHGTTPASGFTPKCLKAVRQWMVGRGWCGGVINRRLARIKTVWGWAVSEELVPPAAAHGLREVKGFRRGEMGVKERTPRRPPSEKTSRRSRPFAPPPSGQCSGCSG